jgi:Mor family transcriptional regulator
MRDMAICDEYASGHSVATLAHRYQLTDRQIWRILAASPAISRVR